MSAVACIVGDPIAHSRSPAIHNAAYAALGLDWTYVAFRVGRAQGRAALEALVALGLAGANVTYPLKEEAAAACDELSDDAAALGAVNTVVRRDRSLRGDSTDGAGFLDALARDGVDVAGRRVLVAGAGGAARAIVLAVGRAGGHVAVAARRVEAARAAAALAPGAAAVDLADRVALARALGEADVVVQATPVGMAGEPPVLDVGALPAHAFVAETIYHPAETPLLAAARARGLRGANGLGMLVFQAARSFELLTGVAAPVEVMLAAAG